jgi:hypothetical protein
MSLHDTTFAPPSKRRKPKPKSKSKAEAERRQRQREPSYRPLYRVIPFLEWCELNGFSRATGQRLIRTGRVKVTRLSQRRIGIREDHNAEFQDSCIRGGA